MATTDRRGVSVSAVDTAIAGSPNPGLAVKAPVLCATTANIVLSGLQAIDGVTVAAGNRVLVKNQTTASQNGLYNASTGSWTRTVDLTSNDQIAAGLSVFVTSGTANANTRWVITSADPMTIGTTSITWAQQELSVAAFNTLQTNVNSALAGTVVTATNQVATFANSRLLAATAPITVTDGGAGGNITVALTTPLSQANGGTGVTSFSTLNNARLSKTANYTVLNADKMKTIALSGGGNAAIKTLTFTAASGYDADFMCLVLNEDSRGWSIAPSGITAFILWPGQTVIFLNQNNTLQKCPSFQRYYAASFTLNVDPVFGSDSNDGLGTGSGAMLTVLAAWNLIRDFTDGGGNIQLVLGGAFGAIGTLTGDSATSFGRLVGITGDATLVNPPVITVPGGGTGIVPRDGAWMTLNGLKFASTGNGAVAVNPQQKSLCDLANISYGAFPLGDHVSVADGADCNITAAEIITGGAGSHWYVSTGGKLIVGSVTVNGGLGAYAFTTGFVLGTAMARISLACGFSQCGNFTGSRYALTYLSLLQSGGNTPPGNSGGTADATSVYV